MADKKQQAPDVPVYLFTGFLEAGKTKFIQETLEDNRFHKGERTLLLLCEDGEEVYEPDRFCAGNVYVRNVDEESDLTRDYLLALQDELHPERVLVEYNGMWMLDSLYGSLPENWAVAQEFLFCDATTFVSYNANMRQLTVDKLKSAELVVLNRYNDSMDRMEMHRIIRAISRRCDIAYEYTDGKVVYDDIEDPLPFDVDAPVIEIEDRDFALWYRDMSEEPKKYDGKTVEVKCRCLVRKNVPKGCFIAGRHIMTCCVQDIQFVGMPCKYDDYKSLEQRSWINITAKVNVKYAYGNQFNGDPDITAAMDTWYAGGTQVVFACGGGIFTSAADAAKKVSGAKMIGVDVDQAGVINGYSGVEDMTVTSAMKGLAATVKTMLTETILNNNWDKFGGKVESLGLVSGDDPELNYVQIPMTSTQWADGKFTQADYKALVKAMFDGTVKVSNDITAMPKTTTITVEDLGNLK